MPQPTDADLARIYATHRKQIARWRDRGIDVHRPGLVLEALAAQGRPGRTFRRLIQPDAIRDHEAAIQALILGVKTPPQLTEKLTRL